MSSLKLISLHSPESLLEGKVRAKKEPGLSRGAAGRSACIAKAMCGALPCDPCICICMAGLMEWLFAKEGWHGQRMIVPSPSRAVEKDGFNQRIVGYTHLVCDKIFKKGSKIYVFCSATRKDLQVTHYGETSRIPEYNYTLCSPDNIIASMISLMSTLSNTTVV